MSCAVCECAVEEELTRGMAALRCGFRGLAEELRRKGAAATAVCPAPMRTEFLEVGRIAGRSDLFERLPYCDQVQVAGGALRAARAGRTIYTPRLFYKFYRLLAKVTPVKLMVKFTKT